MHIGFKDRFFCVVGIEHDFTCMIGFRSCVAFIVVIS